MITIEVRFIAGRYHATPWGRHVNEGEVAWPPEPWRVLRALIAAWHFKANHERFREEDLASLIDNLASDLPCFRLPRVTHSHLRSYMPVHEGMKEKRTLIFDGFLSVDPQEPLVIQWPAVAIPTHESELLAHLLSSLGYFGRAESWCEARLSTPVDSTYLNSMPLTADERGDVVELLAPMSAPVYRDWREKILESAREQFELKGKAKKHLESTVPPRLLDLLRVETSDFQAAGWSHVPGARRVSYVRPEDWNVMRPGHKAAEQQHVTSVRFALVGRPLPRIEDAVRIGELVRAALMKHAGAAGLGAVPSVLSGRENGDTARDHQHAYFLPEDADGDGWIDHVLVHAEGGFGEAVAALLLLRKLWVRDGNEWRVLLEWMGTGASGRSSLIAAEKAILWRSVTPYLHPWFRKRGFDYPEQIARELAARHIDVAEVRAIAHLNVHGKELRPLHFHRFRSRRGLTQPDRQGGFFELRLRQPATGPIALGFGSHYGLGLFRPVPSQSE